MDIKKEAISDNEGGTVVARRTKRQKTCIDWSFLKYPRKKRKTSDDGDGILVALSTGTAPTIQVKQEKPPEENLQLGEGNQNGKCNIDSSNLPSDERNGDARVDNMEADRRSESTLRVVSEGEFSDKDCRAIPDHCYAVKPGSKKTAKLEPKAKPVEMKRVPRPTVDLATLAVYRALIDHTYSSISPSNLIDAVMLKHHYICTIQNLEFQEDYSSKAGNAEVHDSKYNRASNSQPRPEPSSITRGTVIKKVKEVKPKKDVSSSKREKSLPKGPKAVMKSEKSKAKKKDRSTKGCPVVKLRKRETSPKSQKVSMKKTAKSSTKQVKVLPTKKLEVDEEDHPPSLSTKTEEQNVKSKKRRRRNQTGWPTKYKAQPKKSSTSLDKAEMKNSKSRSPKKSVRVKKSTSRTRGPSVDETSLKDIKMEKDDASTTGHVNVSIEESVKRRHQSLQDSKGGPTSPKKKVREEGKCKYSNLDEQEKGTSKRNHRKTVKKNLVSCIKKEVMSCDEGGNSEPERNGPMDDAETSSHSVHSQASSPASSPRKSVVPPDRVVSRSTSSSSTASTKVNSKGVKSSPVSRPSLSKRSSRRSRRSKDPSNESDESTSKGNKTKHSNSNPSSTSSKLPEKSRSTKHHKERANAKGRSLASETKKPLMIKYIKSEVGDTDDAMPSSDDISTVDDTTGSRTANPKVRMNLRKRIKCQVATLFKPRCTSKSKSSRSQPVEPVEIKQEVDDEHHMSDSNICDSINRRPKNLPVIKKGQPKKIWGLTNDSSTGESTAESQDQGETAHNIMPATSSEISDNKSDELSETPPNVDDEDRRAELGLAIVKVETLEFMTGDSYPGESPEDIDESFCASTSNENQGVQSAVRDSNEDHSRETNVDDNLLCSEDFICDSDSYPNGELGGDSRVRQEVVDPPLENLDYTGWKNTKIIYTTDVSDLESEDECCIGETTEFRHQSPCEPALGDNEDDEVRKLEILRVIGCSSDVGVKSIKSGSEQLKPENSTEVDDSTCDSEGNSPIARVVRRYCNKTCQTDTLSAPPAGRDPKPAVCYNSDFQDEYNSYSNPEYPSTSGVGGSSGDASHKKNSKVLSKTEKTQCDPEPTDHTFVERTSSSGEPEENKKTLTVDPVIGNGSSDRSHPGTKAVTLMEGRFPKPVLGADNSQFDRRELEEDPTSSVLVPQVDWDLRIKKRRDKLRKLKHKQRKFRQKLRSVRRFSLSGNGLVARFLRGSVGFGSMGKRCSFYSATTPVGDCSYSSSLASPKTDILCGGTPSHGVVDLTKSPEVDRSRVGMKARRIFRVTPAILRRRPEVKNMMVKSKKTDPCRVPSIHRCGKPQPLLPKLVSAERPEERSTVVVHPPHCDAETCTAGGHLPPRESSRTRTDPREVSEMSLECTEELTEILSDDEGALVDVNNHLAVDGVRPLDVLGNSPVSLTSAHGLVDDVGLESHVLQQDPPVVEPTLEMGRYFLEARSHPPVVEPTCETDRDSHQHPTTEEPLFETDSQRIGKMTSIGRRTTTKREKALRESQQIIDEHAYCLKESANSSRISEGNKRYVIAERANFVSEKLITKNFPMVVKKRSVTVKVPKTPFAREIPSGDDQPMVPLSPDPSDLTSIVAPLPTPKNDSKTVHSRAYAPGYRSWDVDPLSGGICGDNTAESNVGNQEPPVSIYHPPPEIARLDLRVRKRLGLPCDNISYIIKKDGRPPFSYQTIAAMAIESDPLMAAKASDIYDFMKKHFSFYRSITSRWWKQNLRSMLCSSKIFRSDRIGNRVYFSFRKAWRLPGDPAIYEMLDEPPEKQNSDEDDTGIETDTNNDEDNSPTESNSCFPLDLLTPQVDLQETSELDPLIPICSYSDDESDGFPIIVDTTTYTGDHLPKPEEDDEYGLDMEIKGEPDDGTDCERPAEPKSVSADGKRVYACPYCPAVFDTLQGNLDHSVIHPEVMKPCPLCDFSSPDEVQLLWHVNSAHNK